jgi:hypothetical protein
MANTKISQLPSATTPLVGTELVPIVQGGVTKNVAAQNVVTPGGSTTQIQYNNAGAFAGATNVTYDGTNVQLGATGALQFADTDSSNYVAFKAPATIASNVTWTLPNTDGLPDQVLITNGFGVLSWATPTLTPTAPTNNTLPVLDGTPTVGETLTSTTGTWSGYPAPSFQYQWVRGASTNISGATSSSYQLQDADLGSTVKCRVTATNTAGSSNATSAATAAIAAGAPQAPTGVTAVAGNTQATVSFSAPAITGGSPITGYTVTSSPGGFTSSGVSLSQTVTGLTNGTSYTFTVTATNAIGTGPAGGPSNPVVPSFTVEYLVVAGGGGGGTYFGGGGGAGGYLQGTTSALTIGNSYTVTVGAGATAKSSIIASGAVGNNSVFDAITAIAGGGGSGGGQLLGGGASSGGSGGGGGSTVSQLAGAAGTSGQGFAGGTSPGAAQNFPSGGGGGASAVGQSPANTSSSGGNGGPGVTSSITGTSTGYAGGGGAGAIGSGGTGTSGGGNGATYDSSGNVIVAGDDGDPNTGGGGGGGGCNPTGSGTSYGGGSGIVVLKIPNTFTAAFSGGLTSTLITSVPGYNIYRVTQGTGTVTFS